MVSEYLKQLHKRYIKGDAREESYYSTLELFLNSYSEQKRKKKIDITVLPKQTEAGNPDFRIWDGKQDVVGYVEAKDIGKDLDIIEDSIQIKRYIKTFPNVILTNFTEFRLYRDGKLIDKVFIAYHKEITNLHTTPVLHNKDKFFELLNKFFSFSLPRTFTAKTLAVELAKRTRFLKDEIITSEIESKNTELIGFFEAFKEYLIAGLNQQEFADLYSQTITYGLFAARLRSGKNFNRRDAINYIPKSIGILRDVFKFISSADLPRQMETIIDDISAVLAAADAKKILDHYYREGKGSDPVLHFYETFLAEYDPATREKRGVYYTPEPVVSFIVRSLHIILKEKFNKPLGLADKNVTLLDPAGGTLSFNAKAIEVAVDEFVSNYGEGGKKKFIKEHILENFYSFELMMAPYAIGHMKLSFLLEELGYVMKDDERAKFYLTNTLEMKELEETKLPGMSSLSYESHEAGKVKKDVPILVIHGNPPYQGHSANKSDTKSKIQKGHNYIARYEIAKVINNGKKYRLLAITKKATKNIIKKQKTWIGEQIEYYKIIEGQWLKEINPKWLQDDYVKFIRFAQWKISELGFGVVGFITNHKFLHNPTFRGMRESLLNNFDEIYILNLHGNTTDKEKTPDGGKDVNVFDIKQGVSITFLIKNNKISTPKVYYSDIYGLRQIKQDYLDNNDIKSIKWDEIKPIPSFYLFTRTDEKKYDEYNSFYKITDIFQESSLGIFTHRDGFLTDIKLKSLSDRINRFKNSKNPDEAQIIFGLSDTRDWKIKDAWAQIQKENILCYEYNFRSFDKRYIAYNQCLFDRGTSRFDLMQGLISIPNNIAINTSRIMHRHGLFNDALVSEFLTDAHYCTSGNYCFPLYTISKAQSEDLFRDAKEEIVVCNLQKDYLERIYKSINSDIPVEVIFYYIYAVLYSNTYRKSMQSFSR